MPTADRNREPFVHLYRPGSNPAAPTLLLLHGTGGNEEELLPLASRLMPDAGVLSPRGKVLERGMPRFFRRFAEGVFDLEDLKVRTAELAGFVGDAADEYGFDPHRVVAIGFSNGANIAGSLLLLKPETLAGAILLRAMVPIVPDPLPAIAGTPVLLSNGTNDPYVSAQETARLTALLRSAGAEVTPVSQEAGHHLIDNDITAGRAWLYNQYSANASSG